jgi:hypothetical protein
MWCHGCGWGGGLALGRARRVHYGARYLNAALALPFHQTLRPAPIPLDASVMQRASEMIAGMLADKSEPRNPPPQHPIASSA